MPRYFADLEAGRTIEVGSVTVTAEEINAFAEQYDPLPYHLDADDARDVGHDGLIASGYQTLCLANRLLAEEFRQDVATVAGIGIDDLRWHQPVEPGDTLVVNHRIADKRRSESRPETGILTSEITVEVDGEPVLTYETAGVVKRRPEE